MALHAVIMAGGAGTRFWPASRQLRPKQFLPLARGRSLIAATLERLNGLVPADRTWIVTNRRQLRGLLKVLPEFPKDRILVEPEARDTAPCVALATALIQAQDPEATMALLPADHLIEPVATFQRLLRRAEQLAADGQTLVTLGIAPKEPATGFGYIETGEALDQAEPAARRVLRFREKPDAATAKQFVAAGNFLWNSGIFVWTGAAIRAAMKAGNKELSREAERMVLAAQNGNSQALTRAFKRAPRTSIDYAVMEKAPKIAVLRADLQWNDLGAFTALPDVAPTDADGNTALCADGSSLIARDAKQNLVYAEGKRTVALFGVTGLVVVAVGDAVLVTTRERSNELKQLLEQIKAQNRGDLL